MFMISHPGQANNVALLQTDILETFFRLTELANLFDGACPNGGGFAETFFPRVDTWFYQHHTFAYSSDVLAPLIFWRPRQLPG